MTKRFPTGLFCLVIVMTVFPTAIASEAEAGPVPTANTDDAILATVGEEKITVGEFRQLMATSSAGLPGQFITVEQRRALLDEVIRHRALVARARAEGYDTDPEVIAVLERAMVTRFQQEELDLQLEVLTISDEEVSAHYNENMERYARPARSKAAIVFIKIPLMASEQQRVDLEEKAERALAEARALPPETLHFGPVARKYSDDRASRYQGGVIGWLVEHASRQYKWDPKVVAAVFSLPQPGEIAPIVHTEDGLYLVRLVDKDAVEARPLNQVRDGIRHQLLRDKRRALREALLAEIVTEAQVQVSVNLLESIQPPLSKFEEPESGGPPALPEG